MRASAARVLPPDIWERRTALDPERSFIVQAPAGSGKTELLIQRYLVLLARVRQPESVLAITFTVKAAGEMRARVLDSLRRAGAGELSDDANTAFTLSLAAAVLRRAADFQWDLDTNPARLRIRTIDSLCAGIARGMPWLARFGAMPRVTAEPEPLYAEAARSTLRMVETAGKFAGAVEKLVLHLDNDFRRAQSMIEALLPARDQWLRRLVGHHDTEALRAGLESTFARVNAAALANLSGKLAPEWRDLLWKVANFAAINRGAVIEENYQGWLFVRSLFLKKDGEWRDRATAREGFPANADRWKQVYARVSLKLREIHGFREQLHGVEQLPAPVFGDAQWEILEALLTLLPAAAAQLRITFQEHGVVDFTEIAQAACRGLGSVRDPSALAFHLGEQYEHLLVDEVQDTSAAQVELIERLTASWEPDDGRTLFLVGDPMQSIYRFRDADVGLFLRIRQQGIGQLNPEPLTLSANFRSRPETAEWVNRSFELIFPKQEDETSGAVTFAGSIAFRPSGGASGVVVHPLFGGDPAAEGVMAAGLAAQASRKGSTAILVRARTHVPEIVAELKRRGIAYRAVEQDLLGELPAVRDLHALTRALLHPADRPAWLAILRAPWCGLTLGDLHVIASGDPYATVWEQALVRADMASDPVRLDRFRAAMAYGLGLVRRIPLRQCVERTWRALGGPESIEDAAVAGDAERYLALVESMDTGGEIADLKALEQRMELLFAQPDAQADDALQIMTIHKAKGLEFDTVIVPGLGREPMRDDRPLLLWTEIPGPEGRELAIAPVDAWGSAEDPIYNWLRHLDRQRSQNESTRLLYVAATRARERLHLIGQVPVKNDEVGKPRAGSLLALLWPVVEPEFRKAFDAGAQVSEAPAQDAVQSTIRRLPADWVPAAFSATQIEAQEPVRFRWVGDTLRHAGTVVHAWLQRIADEGAEQWNAARIHARRPAIEAALNALGVAPDEIPAAVDHVTEALVATLGDVRGRWILRRREEDASEFAAGAARNGAVEHCVIDRTFVEDGVRWIIDYKTSSHQGGSLEEFLEKEVARYRDQLNGYAALFRQFETRPVRLGLYFPLLGAWREWEDAADAGPLFAQVW
ncbi:MAG: DNA helicase UvrD [Acidobacteria bacterium]|nr:DNA helicase UvrD [Acidobacteriota bacterium]